MHEMKPDIFSGFLLRSEDQLFHFHQLLEKRNKPVILASDGPLQTLRTYRRLPSQ